MRYLVVYQENLTKRFSWYTTRFSWSIQKFIFTPPYFCISWSRGEILLVHHEILMVNSKIYFYTPLFFASRGLVVRFSWCTTRFSWWDSLGAPQDSHGQFISRGVRGLKCQCCNYLLQVSNFLCLLASIPPHPWPYLSKNLNFSVLFLV